MVIILFEVQLTREHQRSLVKNLNLSDLHIPYVQVKNSRQSLAYLAAAFYGYPARKMTMIGVTGTDGKTTTCNLLFQILLSAGIKRRDDFHCECRYWG